MEIGPWTAADTIIEGAQVPSQKWRSAVDPPYPWVPHLQTQPTKRMSFILVVF